MDAEADLGVRKAPRAGADRATPRRARPGLELLAGATSQPATAGLSPSGQRRRLAAFVEREGPRQVAENHFGNRKTRPQTVDLAVDGLRPAHGRSARPVGRRGPHPVLGTGRMSPDRDRLHRCHAPPAGAGGRSVVAAAPAPSGFGDSVQPVAQQVGVADPTRPASQHEKDRLPKGVLGMVAGRRGFTGRQTSRTIGPWRFTSRGKRRLAGPSGISLRDEPLPEAVAGRRVRRRSRHRTANRAAGPRNR